MASVSWPALLPQRFLAEGYQRTPGDNLLRSPMEVGPAKQRRRSTSAPDELTGNMRMTDAQLETFKVLYNDDLLRGALRFDWVDPDDGITAVEMRFRARPRWVPRGLDWFVTLELEILP